MRLVNWDDLPQTADDMNRKFAGTYVWGIAARTSETPRVYEVTQIEGNDIFLRFSPGRGQRHEVAIDRWREFDVVEAYPRTLGAVPFFDKVLLIKRTPMRQWHVGLTGNNTSLVNHLFQPQRIGFSEAEAVFRPVYEGLSVKDAVEALMKEENRQAIALSPHYWLAKHKDKVKLYRGRLCLGSFVYGGFFIHKACTDLKQELWDDLKLKV